MRLKSSVYFLYACVFSSIEVTAHSFVALSLILSQSSIDFQIDSSVVYSNYVMSHAFQLAIGSTRYVRGEYSDAHRLFFSDQIYAIYGQQQPQKTVWNSN